MTDPDRAPLIRWAFTAYAQPQEIELYARMFAHLQAAASYGHAARALVIKALGELTPARP